MLVVTDQAGAASFAGAAVASSAVTKFGIARVLRIASDNNVLRMFKLLN
jgi:hypothetical protein